jgi:hypothetical protein
VSYTKPLFLLASARPGCRRSEAACEWRAQVEKELAGRKAALQEEEIGPPCRISRQKNVNPLFPLRSDVAGNRGAKRFRRSAAFNPRIRYTDDAALIGLDSALIARSGGAAVPLCTGGTQRFYGAGGEKMATSHAEADR